MTQDMLDLKDIQTAAEKIKNSIHKTPLIHSNSFSKMTGSEVYIKAENLQKTGSFKVRGAFNKLCDISRRKVIAASMGNHAQAVAFAAGRLGIQAKIVMPVTASIVKEEAARAYGAQVITHGISFKEAFDYARSQKDHTFIHAFDDEKIIAGQGTTGIEIIGDLDNIDAVLVPVGGGGLIAGISVAVKSLSPGTMIIGVQSAAATSGYDSFKKKAVCEMQPLPTIADGIAIGKIGGTAFEIIEKYVDDMILVDEDSIAAAILLFLERKKLVVEGAGAVTLAALLNSSGSFSGKRIVLLASGGNIDFTMVDRIIHRGLVTSGRIGVFNAVLDDVPGSLHAFTGIVFSHRGNILSLVHDRFAGNLPMGKTKVAVCIEVRSRKHLEDILSDLDKKGFDVR